MLFFRYTSSHKNHSTPCHSMTSHMSYLIPWLTMMVTPCYSSHHVILVIFEVIICYTIMSHMKWYHDVTHVIYKPYTCHVIYVKLWCHTMIFLYDVIQVISWSNMCHTMMSYYIHTPCEIFDQALPICDVYLNTAPYWNQPIRQRNKYLATYVIRPSKYWEREQSRRKPRVKYIIILA